MGFPYSSGDVLTAADLNASSGLVLVAAHEVSSGTASFSVNNCFTSTFDCYRIIVGCRDLSNNLIMRMRASGTDELSASYYYAAIGRSSGGSTYTRDSNGNTQFEIIDRNIAASVARHVANFDLWFPANIEQTTMMGNRQTYYSGTNYVSYEMGGTLATTTQYDGFTLTLGGTFSGTVNVYGYNNG